MIKRDVEEKLLKLYEKKEILAIVGPRQVGKTTLMNFLYQKTKNEKKQFISFDVANILNLFENDLESFIEIYVKPNNFLFIDEFQYAKEGGKKLKRIYDEFKLKIVISGSSIPELSIQSLQYLVGRVLIVNIYHLNFSEFLRYKNEGLYNVYSKGINENNFNLIKLEFEEFITYGSYPQTILENDKKIKEEIIGSLVNTYLLKEVRDILQYKNSFEFEKVLEGLSVNLGSLINKSGLSSDLSITRYKIDEILSQLEKTYVITLLKPISSSKIKELVKSPKIYFHDIGFRNYLVKNFNNLSIRNDKGYIYENFVLTEIIKKGYVPQFYNYKNGSEIDFVINYNGKIIGFEIKSSLNNINVEKSISGFIEKIKPNKIYILNEKVYGNRKIENTEIEFTHITNISNILKKEFNEK